MHHSIYWSTGTLVILSLEPVRAEAGEGIEEVKVELVLK